MVTHQIFYTIFLLKKFKRFEISAKDNINVSESATFLVEHILENDPKGPKYDWNNKGLDFLNQQKYEEAIKCYDEAIKLNQKNEEAWYNKGVSLNDLGKYEESLKCYEEAIKLNPKNEKFCYHKIECLNYIGNYEESIKYCNEVLKFAKSNLYYPYLFKAFALFKQGKIEESLQYVEKSLKEIPTYHRALELKGLIYEFKGNLDESIKYLELALNNIPDWDLIGNKEIKSNLERVTVFFFIFFN